MIGQLTKEEVNRKLLHGLAVLLPVSIFYCPLVWQFDRLFMFFVILSLLLFSVLIEMFRLRSTVFGKWFSAVFGSMMRKEENTQLTGATYILGGSLICGLLSLHSDSAAVASFISLTLFILGDAVAAVTGKAIGRIKVGKKTLEGAVGCFILCVLIAGLIFPNLPMFITYWGKNISWVEVLIISSTVSVLELFPIKVRRIIVNDNLYVPAITTFVVLLIHSK